MRRLLPFFVVGVLLAGGAIACSSGQGATDTRTTASREVAALQFDAPLCDQIPSSVAEAALQRPIVRTAAVSNSTTNGCQYFVDDDQFVALRLSRVNYETQKQGQQVLGRTVETNERIPLEHFVAVQEDGLINEIVLELDDDLILAVDRSSGTAVNEDALVEFAVRTAEFLQSGTVDQTGTSETATPDATSGPVVPEPQVEDVLRNFFQLIEENDAAQAVAAMSARNTTDDSTKQAWAVQFDAFNSVKVLSIEPAQRDAWTDTRRTYKAVLDVVVDPSAADAPIPYYGYDFGQNTRWVTLVLEDGLWKVDQIATGP